VALAGLLAATPATVEFGSAPGLWLGGGAAYAKDGRDDDRGGRRGDDSSGCGRGGDDDRRDRGSDDAGTTRGVAVARVAAICAP
jgi:hypothetical protein